MKNTSLLLFIFLICYQTLTAQNRTFDNSFAHYKIDFNESINVKNPVENLDNQIDSIFKLEKEYEFELRIWESGDLINYRKVFIMTLKDYKWNIRYFDWDFNIKKYLKFKEIPLNTADMNMLWIHIYDQHYVNQIPSEEFISHRFINYFVDYENPENSRGGRTELLHGRTYNFELLKPDKKRYFNYYSPQEFHKIFPNIEELYHVLAVIAFVEKYINDNRIYR